MRRCKWFTARFSEYIDGELPAHLREALEQHVRNCAACAHELESFHNAHRALLTLRYAVPTRPLLHGVRARIAEKERRRASWVWLPVPALAAAGLAALLLYAGHPRQSQNAPVAQVQPQTGVTAPAPAAAPLVTAHSAAADVVRQARLALVPQRPALPHTRALQEIRRLRQSPVAKAAAVALAEITRQPRTPALHPATADTGDGKPQFMVVAYRPPRQFCASVQDPDSGENIAEVSVSSSYAPDGTVARAEVIGHFPPNEDRTPAGKATEGYDNQQDKSKIRSDLGVLPGRV